MGRSCPRRQFGEHIAPPRPCAAGRSACAAAQGNCGTAVYADVTRSVTATAPHKYISPAPRPGIAASSRGGGHPSGMCCDTTRTAAGHCCVVSGFTLASEIPLAPRSGIAASSRGSPQYVEIPPATQPGIAASSRGSPRPVRYHPRCGQVLLRRLSVHPSMWRYHPHRARALQQLRGGLRQVRRARPCQLRCGWSF